MNHRFNVIHTKRTSSLNLDQLSEDSKEIAENSDGYILVYKSRTEKAYFIMSNNFTQEEGVYASTLICNSILNGDIQSGVIGEKK